jgi:hypothetical protein
MMNKAIESKRMLLTLASAGYTYSRLARELNVTVGHVRLVALGERKSPRVEKRIKEITQGHSLSM